jgi:hypothetical protein
MKSTNNAQTTEAVNEKAIAPMWQDCIVEELTDEAQAAVYGGKRTTTGSYVAYPGTDEWNQIILSASYVVGG